MATRKTAAQTAAAKKVAARALFDRLKEQLVNLEATIIEIIETRAWAELGYTSFAAAWSAELNHIPLATQALKAHVVYALLDTEDVADVIANTPAVGPSTARSLKRQKDDGVPAGLAVPRASQNTYTVKRHERKKPQPPSVIHVQVTHEDWEQWTAIANALGSNLAEQAEAAVRAHFEKLGKRRPRRAA